MFWAAILPFQITCVLIVVGYTAFVVWAPKWKMKRGHAAAAGVGLAVVGFIPLCLGVDAVLNPFRFGVFHYDSPAEMGDGHADRRLPPAAREITINQKGGGFEAQYSISRADLDDWIAVGLERAGVDPVRERKESVEPAEEPTQEQLDSPWGRHWLKQKAELEALSWSRFSDLGWPRPADVVELQHVPDGAGGTVYYYSENEGRAYQWAGYW